MKRAALLVAALACGAGCRAVIGIDALELVDASSDAAVTSDVGSDAALDAGSDSASLPDAIAACVVNPQSMGGCFGCCRLTYTASFGRLEALAKASGCICGDGGACSAANQCGTSVCPTPMGPNAMTCGMCADPTFVSGTSLCNQAGDQCALAPDCANAIRCLRACNH